MSTKAQRFKIGQQREDSLKQYRYLTAVAGTTYLLWWKLVELFLPGSFNPIGSRLAVVFYCWFILASSYWNRWISKNMALGLYSSAWLITLHYFYLFHQNQTDINWVVGSYITIIAICGCIQSKKALLSYSGWVLFLSVLLTFHDRDLLKTVFLPGTITILTFAYVALRAQTKLLNRSIETTNWFQNIYDAVFEGIVVHEMGIVVDTNEAFCAIFGFRPNEMIGMHVTEFMAPESRAVVLEKINTKSEDPYEVFGLRKDGSHVAIEIRGKNHEIQGRKLRLAAVSDITARRKNEQDRVLFEASQRAIRMRDEFLSTASHELKTPITIIKLQTEMASRAFKKGDPYMKEPENIQKFIDQTDRQTNRLTQLVEEMLDVSTISSRKMKLDSEEFDLSVLVQEIASSFAATLTRAGSSLQIEAEASVWILADRLRVEQVLSNLLSNAIKYGNRKPIQIRVEQKDQEIRITIQDQGIGIPAENQERIFERFERAISSKKISGLGLGLYISKYIVDALNGRIEVESQPDRGARFTVVLPTQISLPTNPQVL